MWLVFRKRAYAVSRLQYFMAIWFAVSLACAFASGEGLWWRL